MNSKVRNARLLSFALLLAAAPLALPGCRDGGGHGGSGATILGTVAFATRVEIPSGGLSPMGLAAADVNKDQILDLVVAHAESGTVRILIGDGAGGFSAAAGVTLNTPGNPVEAVAADFDRDSTLDLAVLRSVDERVSVFRGDGLGGFTLVSEIPTGTDPAMLVAADLDGDLLLDLLVSNTGSNDLTFIKGDGMGGFASPAPVALAVGAAPVGLAVADFEQTGALQVAVADLVAQRISIPRVNGVPGEKEVLTGKAVAGLVAADVDGDGRPDLVACAPGDRQLLVVKNSSAGWLLPALTINLSGPAYWASAGDLNGDGRLDLVVTYPEELCLGVLFGDGTGAFTESAVLPATGNPWKALLRDVTGDGKVDVIAGGALTDSVALYIGTGADVVGGRCFGADFKEPYFVLAADLDGDGISDLVVSDRAAGKVGFFLADGKGGLALAGKIDVGAFPGTLARGDFDADGRQDLVIALENGVRILHRGPGAGLDFSLVPPLGQPPIQAGVGPFEVLALDLTQDGVPEVVAADYGGDGLTVLRHLGSLAFERVQRLEVKDGPLGLAGGDFDGDGRVDVALTRYRASTLVLFQGKGDGTLAQAAELPVEAQPNYVRAADLNGDGRSDLILSSLGGSALTVLIHQQGFGFMATKLAAGKEPSALLATDLNRDGFVDLLVATVEVGDFRVLLGDGQGGFSANLRFAGVRGTVSASLGDFDGDGLGDLFLGSIYNRRAAAFKNLSR